MTPGAIHYSWLYLYPGEEYWFNMPDDYTVCIQEKLMSELLIMWINWFPCFPKCMKDDELDIA